MPSDEQIKALQSELARQAASKRWSKYTPEERKQIMKDVHAKSPRTKKGPRAI